MSYTFLNQRVFGIRIFEDPTDILQLAPYFFSGIALPMDEKVEYLPLIYKEEANNILHIINEPKKELSKECHKELIECVEKSKKTCKLRLPSDTLFWSIFIAVYGESEFMRIGSKYANREWEEKNNIRQAFMEKSKELQSTNHKVTIAATKEMMSEYMTGNKTSLLGVIGMSVYYKMPIVLVDDKKKTYLSFLPQNTERPTCILYKIYGKSRNHYEIYMGEESESYSSFFGLESYLRPLRAISTYTRSEINAIADKFEITRDGSKEEVYRELSEYLVWI
jgi:hypothetical protein